MTRKELIRFIKENDPHYAAFTLEAFEGHTDDDLEFLKQNIKKEKKKEKKQNTKPLLRFVFPNKKDKREWMS
ncbi:MAG: hypothetical protein HY840_15085 [Bacteroidetes bacterium]|nr:hypothetical protein [Bacteroidota bacterium]